MRVDHLSPESQFRLQRFSNRLRAVVAVLAVAAAALYVCGGRAQSVPSAVVSGSPGTNRWLRIYACTNDINPAWLRRQVRPRIKQPGGSVGVRVELTNCCGVLRLQSTTNGAHWTDRPLTWTADGLGASAEYEHATEPVMECYRLVW